MPFTDFPTLVAWIVESGGAGIVSYWLLSQLQQAGHLSALKGAWLRVAAFALAGAIGVGFALAGGALGVYPRPETSVDVLNLIIMVGMPAGGVQQIFHGFRELPKKAVLTTGSTAVTTD